MTVAADLAALFTRIAGPLVEDDMARYRTDPVLYFTERLGLEIVLPHQACLAYAVANMWHRITPEMAELAQLENQGQRKIAVTSGQKTGKALALDTPIPTPVGWTTMGELRVGDTVFDERGRQTRVVRVSDVMVDRECFDVVFDDGTVITADADHEWVTTTAAARRSMVSSAEPRLGEATVTTREIAGSVMSVSRGYNHAIDPCGPIACASAELPIDPYVLGVWLGDGHSADGLVTVADVEIIETLRLRGYECDPITKAGSGKATTYRLRHAGELFVRELRAAGLRGNKHVPAAYLRGSVEQRRDLLAGLLDTDGHADTRGTIEFCNTRPALAEGVAELARSLGYKAVVAEGRATLYGEDCGPKYRVTFTTPDSVFRLSRKNARLSVRSQKPCAGRRAIVEVRPRDSVPVRCIQVDAPSHLFLCSRAFIATHNSKTIACLALWFFECFDGARSLMTAAIASQIRSVLWRELTLTLAAATHPPAGKPSEDPARGMLSPKKDREIRGFTGRDIEALAGISGELAYFVDEASHLEQKKAEAIEGNTAGEGALGAPILYTSQPTRNEGPFFDAFHAKAERWTRMTFDSEKIAEYQATHSLRVKGMATVARIAAWKEEYGEDSPFYQMRVKGAFLKNETGRIITMHLIEQARERWKETPDGDEILSLGFDPAGPGDAGDELGFAPVRGVKCIEIYARRGLTTEAGLAEVYHLLEKHRLPSETPRVMLDAEGKIGSEYYGRLRGESERRRIHSPATGFDVYGVRTSSRFVNDPTKFTRVRDEVWWNLAQWMLTGAIPLNHKLEAELYAPTWLSLPDGRIRATPKDALRDFLGRSPDLADALALAVDPPRVFRLPSSQNTPATSAADANAWGYGGAAAGGGGGDPNAWGFE